MTSGSNSQIEKIQDQNTIQNESNQLIEKLIKRSSSKDTLSLQTNENSQFKSNTKMVKLKKEDLVPIVNKHKILTSTLAKLPSKLTTSNWESWKIDFMIQMRNLKLDKILLNEWEDDAVVSSDYIDLNECARDNVFYNISDCMRNFIKHEPSAKKIYTKLVDHYEGSTIIRGWRLCKLLVKLLQDKSDKPRPNLI